MSTSNFKVNIKSGLKELKDLSDKKAEEQNNLRSNVTYKLIDIDEIRYNYDVICLNYVVKYDIFFHKFLTLYNKGFNY